VTTPDFFEPITGYRVWNVHENGLLCGQAVNEPWPPYAPLIARCAGVASPHAHLDNDGALRPAPVFHCECGVHALKSEDAARERLIEERLRTAQALYSMYPKGRAFGAVKLWGRIIEHQLGYRAEYAYPAELFTDDQALQPKIERLYGVRCWVTVLPALPKAEEPFDARSYYTQNIPPAFVAGNTVRVRPPAHFYQLPPILVPLATYPSPPTSPWPGPPQVSLATDKDLADYVETRAAQALVDAADELAPAPPQMVWRTIMQKALRILKTDGS
jgi:hypothetical protein